MLQNKIWKKPTHLGHWSWKGWTTTKGLLRITLKRKLVIATEVVCNTGRWYMRKPNEWMTSIQFKEFSSYSCLDQLSPSELQLNESLFQSMQWMLWYYTEELLLTHDVITFWATVGSQSAPDREPVMCALNASGDYKVEPCTLFMFRDRIWKTSDECELTYFLTCWQGLSSPLLLSWEVVACWVSLMRLSLAGENRKV